MVSPSASRCQRRAAHVAGTSAPPSSAIRAPKRSRAGCRGEILPGDERLAEAEDRPRARSGSAGRTRTRPARSRVGARVEPHQHEVVALGEHVLLDLLRALGRDQQVEPELAALGGDPDGVRGGQRGRARPAGSAGQTLCASSITMRTGSRSCAAATASPSTAPATSDCSSRVASEPRSTTTQRTPDVEPRRAPSRSAAGPHAEQRSTPRLLARSAEPCASGGRSRSAPPASAGRSAASIAASAAYSSRSAIGSSRSSAAWAAGLELGEVQPQPRSPAPRGVDRDAARRLDGSVRRPPASAPARTSPRRTKSEFGSRITMRRSVSISSRSSITPSEYVLPEPDWPHRNVCRSKPPASSAQRHAGGERQLADVSCARAGSRALQPGADLVRRPGGSARRGTARRCPPHMPSPRACRILTSSARAARADRQVSAPASAGPARGEHLAETPRAAVDRAPRSRRPGA